MSDGHSGYSSTEQITVVSHHGVSPSQQPQDVQGHSQSMSSGDDPSLVRIYIQISPRCDVSSTNWHPNFAGSNNWGVFTPNTGHCSQTLALLEIRKQCIPVWLLNRKYQISRKATDHLYMRPQVSRGLWRSVQLSSASLRGDYSISPCGMMTG